MAAGRSSAVASTLLSVERRNERLGHENLGSLSARRGFVPTTAPASSFPPSHRVWDEVAAELPQLHRTMRLRSALDHLPELSARPEALPDTALLRAATVLGILGHAHHYVATEPPARLPAAVARPWAEVRRRLHRPAAPVLSYADLIVNNWQLADVSSPDRLELDNLRLLVPTVDNREEHVFYLTQLEILARSAPLLPAIADAQTAVLDDDPDALLAALAAVHEALRDVTRKVLLHIDPRPGRPSYVDPVVWAKTVAPFAVPFSRGVLGPSGTASPLFNLLDVFLERTKHESQLGREILQHRASYPPSWQTLLRAAGEVSVPGYAAGCRSPRISSALDDVREAYAGNDGFLGRHRRKVFGYLEIAFKVGRGVTIAGFTGRPSDRTWTQVDDALECSREERDHAEAAARTEAAVVRPASTWQRQTVRRAPERGPGARRRSTRGIPVSELTEHNDAEHGCWIAVHGRVHDVTPLLRLHPGGRHVLVASGGLDATSAFERAHTGRAGAERLRHTLEVGRLRHPVVSETGSPGTPSPRALYEAWVRALFLAVEMQNTLRLDASFFSDTMVHRLFGRSGPGCGDERGRTRYELDRARDTCTRYEDGYLPSLSADVLRPLVALVGSSETRRDAGVRDSGGCSVPGGGARRRDASQHVLRLDDHLQRLVGLLRQGVRCFEGEKEPSRVLVDLRAVNRLLHVAVTGG
ncbi:MAG: cytochrome b5 domain-containing protein [Actinomycetes bacterium]